MRKSLLIVSAMTLLAANAFASKARLGALNNSAHIVDNQNVWENIGRINLLGDYATFEFGPTSTKNLGLNIPENDFNALSASAALFGGDGTIAEITKPGAEGGFLMAMGDAKFGAYFGRKSQFTTLARTIGGFVGQENSIELMYGKKIADIGYGVSLNYSSSDKKQTEQKQSSAGVRFGAATAQWDAYAILGLGSSADGARNTNIALNDSTAKYRGTSGFKVGGGYWFGSMYLHGVYYQDGAKIDYAADPISAGGSAGVLNQKMNVEQKVYEISLIDTVKGEGSEFFYGFMYKDSKADDKEADDAGDTYKSEKVTFPITIGMEVKANSLMTLRGSVVQNVLLGSKKTQGGDASSIANNTTVNAGVGFNWAKITLDATITAAKTGRIWTDDAAGKGELLGNASFTYNF